MNKTQQSSSLKRDRATKLVEKFEQVGIRLMARPNMTNQEKHYLAKLFYEALNASLLIRNDKLVERMGRTALPILERASLVNLAPKQLAFALGDKLKAYRRCKAICDKVPAGKKRSDCYAICVLYILFCGGKG